MINLPYHSLINIIENLNDGFYLVNCDKKIIYWNKAAENITGFTADEVVGRTCADNLLAHIDKNGKNLCTSSCPMSETIQTRNCHSQMVYLRHKQGFRIPVSVRTSPMVDENDEVIGGVELFTDISNFKANEQRISELKQLAFLDNLTQLGNRHYIEEKLIEQFAQKKRLNKSFGILLMDIDNFKSINDTYGHMIGDEILKSVAGTLINSSRSFDFYGRWGGEEFIGIVNNETLDEMKAMAERIRTLISQSYIIHNQKRLFVTVSIGATIALDDDTPKSLFSRSDKLLYQSKNEGKNLVSVG
ncbi:sensor domain-containing diguanylate cyclase [Desulforhopalus singaporensis]|uniref:PAS domain S-box-containing protein/diguanylate cyclase (GGDEF) domain-containing protein n=1 Tax=Desulforhopalus singaporensis TaxID=91360 RepID=A0A1H0RLS5_9BACT|nr:sensor domain-containing diguanylate cyclase [Desulforhopalus singaporensis]SDP30417.1 PAS domain S-box-containing protein/diguanylate cyclase (GGDEF) domain-containing protein [Desulforhopalus singaporensis]